jgi:hypothetical protein
MLITGRDLKISKDKEEDKKVIDAQRFFDQITGEKLNSRIVATVPKNTQVKKQRQGDPHHARQQSFFDFNGARTAVKNT